MSGTKIVRKLKSASDDRRIGYMHTFFSSRTGIETVSKNAVVLGRSKFKALPAALILQSDKNSPLSGFGTSVTICHEDTPEQELEEYVRKADILVAAMGTAFKLFDLQFLYTIIFRRTQSGSS